MRTRILRATIPVVCLAVLAGVLVARNGQHDAPVRLSLSTSAGVDDGGAYVKEAIDNLRSAERFRFVQTVTGSSSAGDPGVGEVAGEVDLANRASDKPKMRTSVKLHRTGTGEEVRAEQVAIGQVLHVKGPGRPEFSRSSKRPTVGKGKNHGRAEDVEVIDPVMLLLEPVDTLPEEYFAVPSEPADGNRSVVVTLPSGDTLEVVIRDVDRLVVGLSLTREGKTASFSLKDFGADITIDSPA